MVSSVPLVLLSLMVVSTITVAARDTSLAPYTNEQLLDAVRLLLRSGNLDWNRVMETEQPKDAKPVVISVEFEAHKQAEPAQVSPIPTEPVEQEAPPHPLGHLDEIMRSEAAILKQKEPKKSKRAKLMEMVHTMTVALKRLADVVDQAIEKGAVDKKLVAEMDNVLPEALIAAEQIALEVGAESKDD